MLQDVGLCCQAANTPTRTSARRALSTGTEYADTACEAHEVRKIRNMIQIKLAIGFQANVGQVHRVNSKLRLCMPPRRMKP